MFALSLIEHNLPIPPHLQLLPLTNAVKGELEKLFLDKVIQKLGLCISVYDIQSAEGGIVLPGEGSSTYKVVFRLVMFRPFVGEVLIGKVEKCDDKGLQLTLGFFNDIYIPEHLLRKPCKFRKGSKDDGVWVWDYEGDELIIEKSEEIRFRVYSIKYPAIPIEQEKDEKSFAPMEISIFSQMVWAFLPGGRNTECFSSILGRSSNLVQYTRGQVEIAKQWKRSMYTFDEIKTLKHLRVVFCLLNSEWFCHLNARLQMTVGV
ncbi:DNA-directed RNA polymerase III subunit rpc8 isoform X2 [Aristolochia californica]